jgi:hypothetical protein
MLSTLPLTGVSAYPCDGSSRITDRTFSTTSGVTVSMLCTFLRGRHDLECCFLAFGSDDCIAVKANVSAVHNFGHVTPRSVV